MKKLMLFAALSLSLLLGNISLVSAENVAVQGNLALIADNGLVAKDILTGEIHPKCFVDGILDPAGNDVADLLGTASNVVIEANNAVVTVDLLDENQEKIGIDIVTVDITDCLAITEVVSDVQSCISTVNLDEGELTIPCVELPNGDIFTVQMQQRGESDNWKVFFSGINPDFSNDNDDNNDDNEDDDNKDDDN